MYYAVNFLFIIFNCKINKHVDLEFNHMKSLYIYVYHSWKKVGILETGFRRRDFKNGAKRQKTT